MEFGSVATKNQCSWALVLTGDKRVYRARFMGLRFRDGTLVVKVVKGRRWAQIRVVDGDAFDPARSGLEIAARTERTARGVRTRVENLDTVGLRG